jgi:photosystem II stability/assembly factor-like uncharacterized protein
LLKRRLRVRDGDVLVLVGTVKGAFVFRSGKDRRRFEATGPFFPGRAVYALAWDARAGRRRLWAAAQSMHWGATLHRSDDFGATWTDPDVPAVQFPKGSGTSLKQVWQIRTGREDEPEVLYCGVEPAALFESRDGGESFGLVRGLWQHPHRPRWTAGGGGLCLHTVLPHPSDRRRMLVAISTGGVYRTDDGGRSWNASNTGIRAEFLPDKHPEFGQCVHKVDFHPSRPDRLFLQNHFGLYRSDDGGARWRDIAKGVPSDFGFPIAVHPHEPDTAFIVPLKADEFRCPPDGRLRVYRTRNAGRSWEGLGRGLPQAGCYDAVLRDALAVDAARPAGVYFGTRGGKLYASRSSGSSWEAIADGLPAVICVKTATLSH